MASPTPTLGQSELAAIYGAALLHADGTKVRWTLRDNICTATVGGKQVRVLSSGGARSFRRLCEQAQREFWGEVARLQAPVEKEEMELVNGI